MSERLTVKNKDTSPLAIKIRAPRTARLFGLLGPNFSQEEYNELHEKFILFDRDYNGHREIVEEEQLQELIDEGLANHFNPWFLNDAIVLEI